jgi:hypothetical protein
MIPNTIWQTNSASEISAGMHRNAVAEQTMWMIRQLRRS